MSGSERDDENEGEGKAPDADPSKDAAVPEAVDDSDARSVTKPHRASPDEDEPVSVDPDAAAFGGSLPRRRAEPRVAAAFRVKYETLNELVTAYTGDVSRGGIYVKTTKFLPMGAVVRIHLKLPEEGPELRAVARVAYVLDEEDAKRHKRDAGMGMEFLDVGGAPLADEIARYIARENPEVEVPPPPAGMSSRVLVVDDDVWHRERAAQLMRDAGHDVVTADNGVKALGLALQMAPDIILTDVQMPVMDGWQLVRMLRARPTLAQIPVIFVTALDSDEQRLQGYRLGVDDYISKPFNDDELALRVQRVLDRARAYPRSVTTTKALRGTLAHVSLASLLAFLEVERRTGLLLIVRPDEIATVYLREGAAVRVDLPATGDEYEGVERLYYVLGWEMGRFELAEAVVDDEDEIGVPISNVLLEHARRTEQDRLK